MNIGVSQILHMYITSLINIAFKHNDILKSSIRKHVNINKELDIVTKTNRANLQVSKIMVVLPPNFLEGDASNVVSIKLKRIHHQGTKTLTSNESPRLHQIQQEWILVPILYWVHGVSTFPNPNKFICKIKVCILS